MSELFSIYEDSLKMVIQNTKSQLDKQRKTETDLNEIKVNITEAERIIKQMDLEMTTTSGKIDKPQLLNVKFRNYRNEVESLKKQFLSLQDKYIRKRNIESLSVEGFDSDSNMKAQRKNLIEAEEGWQGQDSIDQMKRETYRIEDMSNNIALNMNDQTDKMKHINKGILEIEQNVDQSNSLLNRMMLRENRNKAILVIFSVLGASLIMGFLIYNILRN